MRMVRVGVGMLLALVLAAWKPAASAQKNDEDIDETQSQYVRSFVAFVDWPAPPSSQGPRSTLNFCILGSDPYGRVIDDAILGHSFGNRQGVIVRGPSLGHLGICDVVFIGKSNEKNEGNILERLRNQNVLTISDINGFAARGGIIQLRRDKDHLNFLINVDAASRAGLKINASLLALAQIVHDARTPANTP